jgi:hypothetical protein
MNWAILLPVTAMIMPRIIIQEPMNMPLRLEEGSAYRKRVKVQVTHRPNLSETVAAKGAPIMEPTVYIEKITAKISMMLLQAMVVILLTGDGSTTLGVNVEVVLPVGHVLEGRHERSIVSVGESTATSAEDRN